MGFYDKPLTKFERLLETYLAFAPAGYRSFRQALPLWLKQKLHLPREIRRGLHDRYRGLRLYRPPRIARRQRLFPVAVRGSGDSDHRRGRGVVYELFRRGRGNRIQLLGELRFPHSLGLLYSAFTYYTGFRVNSGEYKVMGLAPYGEPIYQQRILEKLLHLKEDGSFQMDMQYFNYCQGLTMTSDEIRPALRRASTTAGIRSHAAQMDLAASLQSVTEEIMLRMAQHVHRQTGLKNLSWPAVWRQLCGQRSNSAARAPTTISGFSRPPVMRAARWEPPCSSGTSSWSDRATRRARTASAVHSWGRLIPTTRSHVRCDNTVPCSPPANRTKNCGAGGRLIVQEKVVGWFQGRMEFGPRAGNAQHPG